VNADGSALLFFFVKFYLFHEGQQGFPVQIPFLLELRGWRIFAAAQLHGDFQTVAMQVVVVLHPTWTTSHTCKEHIRLQMA